jgi:hypothetical protein
MHAAIDDPVAAPVENKIVGGVDLVDEAHLADRPELLLEAGHHILLSEAVRDQVELRILGGPRRPWAEPGEIDRIWDEKAAGPAEPRLEMAGEALIRIMAGAQPI